MTPKASFSATCKACATRACVNNGQLADRSSFGFHKHFVFQAQIARGRREDGLASDEDFFAARHRAAHIVFADEDLNFDRRFRGRLRLFPGIRSRSGWRQALPQFLLRRKKLQRKYPQSPPLALQTNQKNGPRFRRRWTTGLPILSRARLQAAGMDFGAPLPRAIPCAASTCFDHARNRRAIHAAGGCCRERTRQVSFLPASPQARTAAHSALILAQMLGAAGTLTFSCTASGAGEFAAPAMR